MRIAIPLTLMLAFLIAAGPASADHLGTPPTPHVPPCSLTPLLGGEDAFVPCTSGDLGDQGSAYNTWAGHTADFVVGAADPTVQAVLIEVGKAEALFWEEYDKRWDEIEGHREFALDLVGQVQDQVEELEDQVRCNIIGEPVCTFDLSDVTEPIGDVLDLIPDVDPGDLIDCDSPVSAENQRAYIRCQQIEIVE